MSTTEQARPRFRPTPSSSNGDGPAEPTLRDQHPGSRKQQAYDKLSPEQQLDRDRAERIDQLAKILNGPGLSQHDRPELLAEWHQLRAECKAAHPEQVEDDLQRQADFRYQQLLADQQARARLASGGWTPPKVLTEDDVEHLPDPKSLIDGVLDQGTVGVLSGETQTAKSFLGLDWAFSVAYGVDWLTHTAQWGHVVYVAAEDGAGLKFRRRAWRKHYGAAGKGRIHFIAEAVNLTVPEQVDWLITQIQEHDARLAVIDTYAKCAGGTEENSASDTRLIITQLYRIRNAVGGGVTVLLVHHTGYNTSRARGSSALIDNVDFAYNMERDGDAHVYTELTAKKRKDAPLPSPMGFRLKVVELDGGGSSCVLQPVGIQAKPKTRQETERAERIAALRAELKENPEASLRDIAKATGIPKSTVSELLPQARMI
jgi:RecA-family ATPase